MSGIFDNLLRIFESLNFTNINLDGLSVFISKTSKTIILHLIINCKLNTYKCKLYITLKFVNAKKNITKRLKADVLAVCFNYLVL